MVAVAAALPKGVEPRLSAVLGGGSAPPPNWENDDLNFYYAAQPGLPIVNENLLVFFVAPGGAVGVMLPCATCNTRKYPP